jgi:hypothetical protein
MHENQNGLALARRHVTGPLQKWSASVGLLKIKPADKVTVAPNGRCSLGSRHTPMPFPGAWPAPDALFLWMAE